MAVPAGRTTWALAASLVLPLALGACAGDDDPSSVAGPVAGGDLPAPRQRLPADAPPQVSPESGPAAPETVKAADPYADPRSLTVVVNKHRPLQPVEYIPEPLALPNVALGVDHGRAMLRTEVAAAAESMFATALEEGVGLVLVSGYRSFADQEATYAHWVAAYGGDTVRADAVSARPGFSEHQTGLVFDIAQNDGTCTLSDCFANTAAARWVADKGAQHGFIVRYPAGSEDVTGFSAESWHVRYVGVETAQQMKAQDIPTLEEYFGLTAAPGY